MIYVEAMATTSQVVPTIRDLLIREVVAGTKRYKRKSRQQSKQRNKGVKVFASAFQLHDFVLGRRLVIAGGGRGSALGGVGVGLAGLRRRL